MISPPPLNTPAGEAWSSSWANFFANVFQILFALQQSGTTALRPTKGLWIGRPYFDTTLGYPIWYTGSGWVDATGGAV